MSDSTVPMDVTAENAAQVVIAAMAWRRHQNMTDRFTREEWTLIYAADAYGDKYKGLRGQ